MEEVLNLIKSFDIPDHRKTKTTPQNIIWLYQNLKVRNEKHPKYQITIEKIKLLLQEMNVKI